jgi:hypothetical protein
MVEVRIALLAFAGAALLWFVVLLVRRRRASPTV